MSSSSTSSLSVWSATELERLRDAAFPGKTRAEIEALLAQPEVIEAERFEGGKMNFDNFETGMGMGHGALIPGFDYFNRDGGEFFADGYYRYSDLVDGGRGRGRWACLARRSRGSVMPGSGPISVGPGRAGREYFDHSNAVGQNMEGVRSSGSSHETSTESEDGGGIAEIIRAAQEQSKRRLEAEATKRNKNESQVQMKAVVAAAAAAAASTGSPAEIAGSSSEIMIPGKSSKRVVVAGEDAYGPSPRGERHSRILRNFAKSASNVGGRQSNKPVEVVQKVDSQKIELDQYERIHKLLQTESQEKLRQRQKQEMEELEKEQEMDRKRQQQELKERQQHEEQEKLRQRQQQELKERQQHQEQEKLRQRQQQEHLTLNGQSPPVVNRNRERAIESPPTSLASSYNPNKLSYRLDLLQQPYVQENRALRGRAMRNGIMRVPPNSVETDLVQTSSNSFNGRQMQQAKSQNGHGKGLTSRSESMKVVYRATAPQKVATNNHVTFDTEVSTIPTKCPPTREIAMRSGIMRVPEDSVETDFVQTTSSNSFNGRQSQPVESESQYEYELGQGASSRSESMQVVYSRASQRITTNNPISYVNELSNMLKCKSPTFEEADAGVVYVGDQPRTWFGCRISIDEIIGVEGFGKGFRKKDAKVRACATYLSNLASARPILNIPVHAFEKYLESNWEIELQDIPRQESDDDSTSESSSSASPTHRYSDLDISSDGIESKRNLFTQTAIQSSSAAATTGKGKKSANVLARDEPLLLDMRGNMENEDRTVDIGPPQSLVGNGRGSEEGNNGEPLLLTVGRNMPNGQVEMDQSPPPQVKVIMHRPSSVAWAVKISVDTESVGGNQNEAFKKAWMKIADLAADTLNDFAMTAPGNNNN